MNATHAVGWALIHSLWQGAAIAATLGLFLWATPRRAANLRYLASLVALFAVLAVGTATAVREWRQPVGAAPANGLLPATVIATEDLGARGAGEAEPAAEREAPRALPGAADPRIDEATAAGRERGAGSGLVAVPALREVASRAVRWIVPAWLVGVTLLSVRLLGGWFQSHRYVRLGTRGVARTYLDMVDRLRARLRIARPVRILESTLVHVPAVIGWLRPVVLVPTSAFTGLTPQQIEVLIAHELAHVRRHDYLANLLQAVIETLLFYHPAVWWISARIRETREHSCDDVAVAVCGDARLYARALLGMEELRGAPRFAMAASGSPLAARIRRLLLPYGGRRELFPRWIAGAVAAAVALLVAGGTTVSGTTHESSPPAASEGAPERSEPDTIIRHPDPEAPLVDRWRWAREEAVRAGFERYWVAYAVEPTIGIDGEAIYVARHEEGSTFHRRRGWSGNITIITNRPDGMRVGERTLHALVGGVPDDVALVYGFDRGGSLAAMQIASLTMTVDLADRPLLWLGPADDDESIPLIQRLYGDAGGVGVKDYLTVAVGVHGDATLVVPVLIQRLRSQEHDDVRESAVEWLGYHPTEDALAALTRAARTDRSTEVRQEAAEAVGEMRFPAATDSAIALARELEDRRARAEAVEGLGQKRDDPRAVAALARIAREDPDRAIQQEAVESLGEAGSPEAQGLLREILRTHPSPDVRDEALETIAESSAPGETAMFLEQVARTDPHPDLRREAVETLGEHSQGDDAVAVLVDIAMTDADPDVQREAVETLGDIGTPSAIAALRRIAEGHPNRDVRREAIESLGETLSSEEAVVSLARFARTLNDADLQREAVESLGEIDHPAARDSLAALARTITGKDARREAVETVAEALPSNEALAYLADIARTDRDVDVQREAIESLGEVGHPAARDSLMALARTLPNTDARREAIETVGEMTPSDDAARFLGEVARSDRNVDVQREAVESLGDMRSPRASEELLDILRTHPNADVRREAVETVGESLPSDRALEALVEVARTDANQDVQHEVVETLEEIKGGAGISALIEIARTHPNRAMRIEAIKTLAESDDQRARDFLDRALQQP
jgi:HEAT repeat protein/beta-lactamase regulating signal transducer with metallopeptidase domain